MIQRLLEKQNTKSINIEDLTLNLLKSLHPGLGMKEKNSTLICLDMVLTTDEGAVLKHRDAVVAKAREFLADRKRSTRRLAVKCANDWSIA
mmetsp:Transcript_10034/g.8832  ORF Transcript_10034/g.8832 Transcript_10034/m.8832 type:complete len:91 (+) Transcript_10034:128-400(+)